METASFAEGLRLRRSSCVYLVSLADPRTAAQLDDIDTVRDLLSGLGLEVRHGRTVRAETYIGPEARAADLHKAFLDPAAAAVFDVSGGTLAGEVLDFVDFELLGEEAKALFGYSNLTSVLNVLAERCGLRTGLYNVMNLHYDKSGGQLERFRRCFMEEGDDELFTFEATCVGGDGAEGVVMGGNLRSLLQLAGTRFWPDLQGRILFLESLGGDGRRVESMLWQLRQMGVFRQVRAVLLGQFTELERQAGAGSAAPLLLRVCDQPNLPIWKTSDIGHRASSRALWIGGRVRLGD